jgi:molecular chaperone GrpE
MSDEPQEKIAEETGAAAEIPAADETPAVPAEADPAPPPAAAATTPEPAAEEGGEKPAPRKHRRHETDQVHKLKEKLELRERESEALRREIADWKDRSLRTAAEMDNARKRLEREKSEFLQYAQAELFKELLGVLDNFERARRTGDGGEGQGLQVGLELIHKQFTDLLRKRGVTPVERDDRLFDPAVHQAIFTEEKEGVTEAEVGEELQRGYFLHDRLLRPALVKVWLPKKG